MKIVIACDSYKGCMTSRQVATQIEKGIHRLDTSIETVSYVIVMGEKVRLRLFMKPVMA